MLLPYPVIRIACHNPLQELGDSLRHFEGPKLAPATQVSAFFIFCRQPVSMLRTFLPLTNHHFLAETHIKTVTHRTAPCTVRPFRPICLVSAVWAIVPGQPDWTRSNTVRQFNRKTGSPVQKTHPQWPNPSSSVRSPVLLIPMNQGGWSKPKQTLVVRTPTFHRCTTRLCPPFPRIGGHFYWHRHYRHYRHHHRHHHPQLVSHQVSW